MTDFFSTVIVGAVVLGSVKMVTDVFGKAVKPFKY